MFGRRTSALIFSALAVTADAGVAIAASPKVSTPVELVGQNIFLGQVYPSGNLYLKGFTDDLGEITAKAWPPKILFRGFSKEEGAARIRFADFKHALKDTVKDGKQYSLYFPGVEGMDNGHAVCGQESEYKPNPEHLYLDPDFFYTVFDYCDSNNGTVLYVTGKSRESYRVIAFGPSLAVENIQIADGTEGRPLAPGEADEIARKKKAGASALNDCTTVPAFANEAVLLLKFGIAETATTARLSSYDNPGCMGHLETIYLLDVLEEGKHRKTFELHQYKGAI